MSILSIILIALYALGVALLTMRCLYNHVRPKWGAWDYFEAIFGCFGIGCLWPVIVIALAWCWSSDTINMWVAAYKYRDGFEWEWQKKERLEKEAKK